MKKSMQMLFAAAVMLVLASCGGKNNYVINGELPSEELNGKTLYLINANNAQGPVDSTTINGNHFTFNGTVDEPWIAAIVGEGVAFQCFVEPGKIGVTMDSIWGTVLNDRFFRFTKEMDFSDLENELQQWEMIMSVAEGDERDEAERKMDSISEIGSQRMQENAKNLYLENKDNILGAMAFELMVGIDEKITAKQLEEMLKDASPVVANYKPVQERLEQLRKSEATSVGKHYTDISGQWWRADGNWQDGKLSDLAEGRVTLVDFFASWCSPCRQEIKNNLIGIYDKYKGKGLVVVGLNVWERGNAGKRAADLQKTLDDLGIGYPVLVDSTHTATDTYGVLGIPQIMLIGKDGTILARDLRGKDIEEAVKNALSQQ
ncbi:MAG: AhpC/TSA family protein [Bacteroidales bacterium]|nr:AhpC/TSA family protein [Bacteroidales bacterium]